MKALKHLAKLLLPLALCCGGIVVNGSAQTVNYPSRPVRIIVPAAPGGALDLMARLLAPRVSKIWKQSVVVENRPGANFIIGMNAVAKSPSDGYTLLETASAGITINPYVFQNMPLDPLRELTPVLIISQGAYVLLVNKNLPVKSLSDFVALLRQNPGKYSHASNSASTILVSELFKSIAKVDYVDVNYRGASEAIVATQSGVTQFCFVDGGSAVAAMKGGTLRPLAQTTPTRSKLLPDIPTFVERGITGLTASTYVLLMAPAQTPPNIVDRINEAFQKALHDPEVIKAIARLANEVGGTAKVEVKSELLAEAHHWQQLIMERNIKFGH